MLLEILVLINGIYDILCFVAVFSLPWHKKRRSEKEDGVALVAWQHRALAWTKRALSFLAEIHPSIFSSPVMRDCEDDDSLNVEGMVEMTANTSNGAFENIPSLQRRIVAYWILTYGLVRLVVAIYLLLLLSSSSEEQQQRQQRGVLFVIASSTYFVEGVAFALEDLLFLSTVRSKSAWVYGTSFVLGILTLLAGLDKVWA